MRCFTASGRQYPLPRRRISSRACCHRFAMRRAQFAVLFGECLWPPAGSGDADFVGTVNLKKSEQSFPAYQAGVHQRIRVGEKSLANLAGLPGVRRNVERHIDHHRRSDNVVARHAAPKTAVVRVARLSPIQKITVGGHCEGLAQVVGLGASGSVVSLRRCPLTHTEPS